MLGCPWYAEPPQAGVGVAARPFTAVPAMPTNAVHTNAVHTTLGHMSFMPMTVTAGSKSTRSLINDHKIGRPKVPGGPTG
jgi:hypothetical protein